MAAPSLVVNIAANNAALKAAMVDAGNTINTTAGQLAKMAASFDGSKIIAQANAAVAALDKMGGELGAIGGVTQLTASEQAKLNVTLTAAIEKYALLGKTAPESMIALQQATTQAASTLENETKKQTSLWETMTGSVGSLAATMGLAFGVGAVVNFGEEVIGRADDIETLSQKLDVSMEAVQRWGYAADQTGASMDDVGRSVAFLNKTLAEDTTGTVAILKQVGLSFDDVRSMRPEDAFNTIAEAIQKIPDPMLQAEAAVKLFGRAGQDLLPAIREGFVGLGEGAHVMADQTVEQLVNAKKSWKSFWDGIVTLTGTGLADISALFTKQGPEHLIEDVLPDVLANYMHTVIHGVQDAQDEIAKSGATFAETAPFSSQSMAPLEVGADEYNKLVESAKQKLEDETTAQKAATEAAKVHADEVKRAGDMEVKSMDDLVAGLYKFDVASQNGQGLRDLAAEVKSTATEFRLAVPDYVAAADALDKYVKTGAAASELLFKNLPHPIGAGGLKAAPTLAQSLFGMTSEQLASGLGQTILAAAEGGGDAAKSAGSYLGGALAEGMIGKDGKGPLGKALTDGLGKSLGGAIGSLIPGLGTILGGLGGALAGKLIGGLKNVFDNTQGRDLIDDFANSLGGFDALHQQLDAIGASGEQMWIDLTQGVNKGSPAQAQAEIDNVKAALKAYSDTAKDAATWTANLQGDFTTLQSSVAAFGGVAPRELQPMIQDLLQMNGLTADQKTLLQQLAGDPSMDSLQTAADDLGVSFDHMGQAFKAAQIDKQAFDYQHDLDELANSGADMNGVLTDSAGKISALVQSAIESGVALPQTMQPYIDKLSDMGLLLGPDGLPEDISKLTFADIPDDALSAIKDILGQIRDLLLHGIPDAAAAAASAINSLPSPPSGLPGDTAPPGSGGPGDSATGHGIPDPNNPFTYTDGSYDPAWPYADMPVSMVKSPGAVFVNPGDIIGMPKYGSNLPSGGSTVVVHLDARGSVGLDTDATIRKLTAAIVPHLPAEWKRRGVIR